MPHSRRRRATPDLVGSVGTDRHGSPWRVRLVPPATGAPIAWAFRPIRTETSASLGSCAIGSTRLARMSSGPRAWWS